MLPMAVTGSAGGLSVAGVFIVGDVSGGGTVRGDSDALFEFDMVAGGRGKMTIEVPAAAPVAIDRPRSGRPYLARTGVRSRNEITSSHNRSHSLKISPRQHNLQLSHDRRATLTSEAATITVMNPSIHSTRMAACAPHPRPRPHIRHRRIRSLLIQFLLKVHLLLAWRKHP